ncbi:MAG: hypothetical protein JWR05_3372 [Mucilaginibacter sp.]|nr:hypothetical protein [Mucilaginibacter sp.]
MAGLSIKDRINIVYGGGGHVVILGAGASIASTIYNSEPKGKKLPSMDNFIDVVGLRDLLEAAPSKLRADNFETFYSLLHEDNPSSSLILELEMRVRDYFADMELPPSPTIYDYLVLSLRPRDLIATFNWDPFLYQAWTRNHHVGDMPYIAFLHGNVAIGYDDEDKRCGPAGMISKKTYNTFVPTKLLYPVTKKNYNNDEFIRSQWDMTKSFLSDKSVARFTIFGYGAPKTDQEAMMLLNDAWGTSDDRVMEQMEMIDVRNEQEVKRSWNTFINTHHYDYVNDYFRSSLASNPRRTFESYHQHNHPMTIDEALSASNPVPNDFKTLEDLWAWHKPLIDAEEKWKRS